MSFQWAHYITDGGASGQGGSGTQVRWVFVLLCHRAEQTDLNVCEQEIT